MVAKVKNKKNEIKTVENVFIVDRSGSMQTMKNDAIGGYNAALQAYKESPDAMNLTLVIFDDVVDTLYSNVPKDQAVELDDKTFVPRGSTALNDAIGKTIAKFIERREKNEIGNVVFSILTDGGENASIEYTRDQIKDLIKQCEEKYTWSFNYLAANQDAFAVGSSYGFSANNTANFANDGLGMLGAIRGVISKSAEYTATAYAGNATSVSSTVMQDIVDKQDA